MLPRLFHLYGPFWVHSYGIMIALGFIVFLLLTLHHPERKKLISEQTYLNTLFVGLLSGIIGGRLLFVISEWEYYANNMLEIIMPWEGGFIVLGSIIGVLITVPAYLIYHKVQVLKLFDLAALYAPIMQAIGRIGCLLAGCCHGKIAPNLSWSITFTSPESLAPCHLPLHPTQLYLMIASLGIFFILIGPARLIAKKPGIMLCIYLMLESIARFGIDYWRGDRGQLHSISIGKTISTTLSAPQVYSAVFFIFCIIALIILSFGKQNKDA